MPKTKKQLILQSFEKMDINMLHVLLNDDITFQDASKETFLSKLEVVFSKLKAEGDSCLQLHKGFCKSDACDNKGCKGFSFIGNKSNYYIDLIFTETEDDFTDIYYCHEFQTDDRSVEKECSVPIEIKKDETQGFVPTIDFLLVSQKCKTACDELLVLNKVPIGSEVYLKWLQKHQSLNDSLDFWYAIKYVELCIFNSLHRELTELRGFLAFSSEAKQAVEEFETINKNDEINLLKWLVDNEGLSSNFILFLYEEIDFEYHKNSEFFQINGLKIRTDDFAHIAKFKFYFDEHYWGMLEKYSVFTDEEAFNFCKKYPGRKDITAQLSYSLRKRGMIP